jgi:hypothetical protein
MAVGSAGRGSSMASRFPVPVAVGTSRRFNAFAIPTGDVMPAAQTDLMTG